MLSALKLVATNLSVTSFEPDSIMEFGFKTAWLPISFHCNNVSLYHFQDTVTYLPKSKEVTWFAHTQFWGGLSCTEVHSFTQSKDTMGPKNFLKKWTVRPSARPLWVCFSFRQLILNVIYQCIKFENSSFIRSKDIEGRPKIQKITGKLEQLGSLKVICMSLPETAHTISYSPLIETTSLSCTEI